MLVYLRTKSDCIRAFNIRKLLLFGAGERRSVGAYDDAFVCSLINKHCPAGPANTLCWFVTARRVQIQGSQAHQQYKRAEDTETIAAGGQQCSAVWLQQSCIVHTRQPEAYYSEGPKCWEGTVRLEPRSTILKSGSNTTPL